MTPSPSIPGEKIMEIVSASAHLSRYARERAIKWAFPQLTLRIHAVPDGIRCYAIMETLNAKGQVHVEEIARATWRPLEVSEELVVNWGVRALESWLSTRVPTS